ncbi:unnamed protein product [Orchesella dallaii]|uniref:DUF4789 domain-containing protein n=1 Tax=Orchesella dallaii TaxID=48710 RepID=A0ABP1QYY5_9HEXA
MSSIFKTFIIAIIAIIGISDALLQDGGLCNSTKSLQEASLFRPIAEGPEGMCFLAYDQGPCKDGEWFSLTWDHDAEMLSRKGNCTARQCMDNTDEGDANGYKKFSFYYEGKCLISGAPNSDYCEDNLNVYFNHREHQPICRTDAPEIEVQTGRLFYEMMDIWFFKALRGDREYAEKYKHKL